jgi:hypothetical protein
MVVILQKGLNRLIKNAIFAPLYFNYEHSLI